MSMNWRKIICLGQFVTVLLALSIITTASSESVVTEIIPGKVILNSGYGIDAYYLAGTGYRSLEENTLKITLFVDGLVINSPVKRSVNGYFTSAISVTPKQGGSEIVIERSLMGRGLAVAISPSSTFIPASPNVVLTVTYGLGKNKQGSYEKSNNEGEPQNESGQELNSEESKKVPNEIDEDYPRVPITIAPEGEYELPPFPYRYKYSDALVSINLVNTDFRDVLMLLSEIGNVSIVLDPYWSDPPTGGRRRPGGPGSTGGAGAGGGAGGAEGGQGGGGTGFREAGTFQAQLPRPGTGNLTLNLENVPFDLALDLILTAVNLEKIDVYPGFFNVPVAGEDKPERVG